MEERGTVEGSKDVVHLVRDVPEKRWHSKREDHVPEPVGRSGQIHGLGADARGVDLGRIGPSGRAPSGGKGGHKW